MSLRINPRKRRFFAVCGAVTFVKRVRVVFDREPVNRSGIGR